MRDDWSHAFVDSMDAETAESVWLAARSTHRRRVERRRLIGSASVATVAFAAVWWWIDHRVERLAPEVPELTMADGSAIPTATVLVLGDGSEADDGNSAKASARTSTMRGDAGSRRRVAFTDGSSIENIGASPARLVVVHNRDDELSTQLLSGSAQFTVTPGGPRRWTVATDLATVEVVGTQFSVDNRGDVVSIAVSEGKVVVRSKQLSDRVVSLTAGQSLTVGPRPSVGDSVHRDETSRATPVDPSAQSHRSMRRRTFDDAPSPPLQPPSRDRADKVSGPSHQAKIATIIATAQGHRAAARADAAETTLRQGIIAMTSPAERAVLRIELGRLLMAQGRTQEAKHELLATDEPGVPRELVETARTVLEER